MKSNKSGVTVTYSYDKWYDAPNRHDDVVKVIRCKDCKYCRTYYHGENMPFTYACDKLYLTNNLSSDDYCSRAERKEE